MIATHTPETQFYQDGWACFDHDPALLHWVTHALPAARALMRDSDFSQWWRYDNTWFVGVNALPNDRHGQLIGGPPLQGNVINFVDHHLPFTDIVWDQAQVSICFPGYPGRGQDEPESAHRYRVKRDAAHIDGLRRVEPNRRRFLNEYHGYILGIPMVEFSQDAAPFVVWRGSHRIAHTAFESFYQGIATANWATVDATSMYQSVRQQIFDQCERVEINLKPGQTFIVHRFALHGMAPWGENATATADGRMICYFRPEIADPKHWLNAN